MTLLRTVLLGSLAANAALAALFAFRWSNNPGSRGSDSVSREHPAHATRAADRSVSSASITQQSAWDDLHAGTGREFVARLRAEGYPEVIIATIARAEIAHRFSDRQREIEALKDAVPWWRRQDPFTSLDADPKVGAATRALRRDMDAAIHDWLGTDALLLEMTPTEIARNFGDLPPEKILRLRAIQRDYSDMMAEVRSEAQGVVLSEDRERLALLEEEKRNDLRALLTPAELAEYELRSGPTAGTLRYHLSAFEPSESEYRAIYALRKEVDDRFDPPATLSDSEANAKRLEEVALDTKIASVLGPERFAEYQVTTHRNYRNVRSLVTRLGLPVDRANSLVNLEIDTTRRAEALRQDSSLTAEDRNAQLAALATAATDQLTHTLGPDGLPEYRRNHARWLDSLQPKGRPSP